MLHFVSGSCSIRSAWCSYFALSHAPPSPRWQVCVCVCVCFLPQASLSWLTVRIYSRTEPISPPTRSDSLVNTTMLAVSGTKGVKLDFHKYFHIFFFFFFFVAMERCSKVWREHSPRCHPSSFRVLGHRNTQICVTHPSAHQTHRSRSLRNMWPSVLNFTTVYNQTLTQTISRPLIGSYSLTSLCSAAWLTSQPAAETPARSTRAIESVTAPTSAARPQSLRVWLQRAPVRVDSLESFQSSQFWTIVASRSSLLLRSLPQPRHKEGSHWRRKWFLCPIWSLFAN